MRLNEYRKLRQMPNNLSNFRIQDAANYLGVSSKTLRRWGKSGKLVSKRSEGGHRYYTREQLDTFRFADKTETVVSPSPLKNKDYTISLAFTVIMLCVGLGLQGRTLKVESVKRSDLNSPAVLAATDEATSPSVAGFTFAVNVPSKFSQTATFEKDIVAPNVVYSVNGKTGDVDTTFSLEAGSGISITNRTITNSGIVTLSAGTGISVDGNKITNTYSFTPDYTQSGWTRTGTTVGLTTLTDSVTVGALTIGGNTTISNGYSILPSTDLGSDLGSSTYRFNNLWVANINSNSSQSFSGQTTFSYPPTDTTINQASVLINPTTAAANGQLLGLAIAGYQRAVIDEDGDIILGYNSLTSPPATDYPLDIYGHSGTRVAYVDTSGNINLSGSILKTDTYDYSMTLSNDSTYHTAKLLVKNSNTSGKGFAIRRVSNTNHVQVIVDDGSTSATLNVGGVATYLLSSPGSPAVNITGGSTGGLFLGSSATYSQTMSLINNNVGIGTTSPSDKLHVYGGGTFQNASNGSTVGLSLINGNGTHLLTTDGYEMKFITPNNASSVISFRTSANEAMRITNAGNVGIGTTSPLLRLSISDSYSGFDYGTPTYNGGGGAGLWVKGSNIYFLSTGGQAYLRFTSANDYGSDANYLQFLPGQNATSTSSNRSSAQAIFKGSYWNGTAAVFANTALYNNVTGNNTYQMTFQTADLTRLVVDQSGLVGIGTTAPSEKLEVAGNIKTSSLTTGTVYSNAGVLTNTDPSDVNLKTNVLNLPDGTLDKVLGLRTVSYNWKSTGDGALGFVAQEVQQVFPELVGTNNDGTLGLYTTQFIPLLTKAMQEQQLEVNKQKTKLDDFIAYVETIINGFKNKFVTKQSIQEELCVGTEENKTCLNKEKIDVILNNLPSPTSTPTSSDSIGIQSGQAASPSPIPTPTSSDSIGIQSGQAASPSPSVEIVN